MCVSKDNQVSPPPPELIPPILTLTPWLFQVRYAPSSSSSSSSLSHFYVGSMWDDSRLRAARSYTSSPDSPFSLRTSFTQSAHLFFGLPLLPLPCTSTPIALFPTYSSLLVTRPYRRIPRSWTFFEISPTFVVPLIFSFLILSDLVDDTHPSDVIHNLNLTSWCVFILIPLFQLFIVR